MGGGGIYFQIQINFDVENNELLLSFIITGEMLIQRSHLLGDRNAYARAKEKPMPSCETLENLHRRFSESF